jgi:hypothetical protein
MNIYLKKILLLLNILLSGITVMAQVEIVHAENAPGKLTKSGNTLTFIRSFKALPEAKASSLAKTADKLINEVCSMPQLKSPVGFNVNVFTATGGSNLKQKEPVLKVSCFLRYLLKDSRTGEIKKSMDGTDIYLDINAFDVFSQMGNYWEDCSKLKFPLFFEEVALSDSTNDYIAFKYKGWPIRMVLANKKQLFVPLTRKEFLQFLLARGQKILKENEDALQTSYESKEKIAKLVAAQSGTDKDYAASSLKSVDYTIEQWKKNIEKQQEENEACKSLLNSMKPEEATSPARMDYNKKGNGLSMGCINQLVPVGRKEGVMLTKINPAYYDHSANASAAQMIMVYYAWPVVGYEEDPDYLQQITLDIFNHLDYHALKMSMQ